MNDSQPPSMPRVRLAEEVASRKKHDGPVIEPTDLFDVHGRHIVMNQVVEGGKPTGLLRYTILSTFEIDMPNGTTQRYDITCPMNGFKGGRKQAFEMHDEFLKAYRETFEVDLHKRYLEAEQKRLAAEAGNTEKKPESKILGADGQSAGSKQIEIPAHDPTLSEQHVPKDGTARKRIESP